MPVSAAKLKDPRYLVALGFGSGLSPKAPGTVGTLLAVLPFLALSMLHPIAYAGVVIVALIAGIYICDWVANDMAVKDPGAIVWDEFVGLWVGLFMLPAGWWWLLAGVLLFRFFDVLKPWPVSFLDRNLSGGAGIMLDDIAAGVYTLIMIQLAHYLLPMI